MIQQFDSLMQMMEVFSDEQVCIDRLRSIRWKNGAFCPHCGGTKIYNFSDGKTHKCGDCRQRFSIKVGTIFEDSKIPLRKWFMAVWLITSHKKGIASTQLAKDLQITQKSAWFVLHRLRYAAQSPSFNAPLAGEVEVEVDETYVGGKGKNMHKDKKDKIGRGTSGKTAVVGAVERGGNVIATVVPNSQGDTLREFVRQNVSSGAKLLATDEAHAYKELAAEYNHGVVRHGAKQYVDGRVHTNTIEGYWSLLKRQIIGIHHWISPKHLNRYVAESAWRHNRRGSKEGNRVNQLLEAVSGRLTYKALIA